MSNYKIISWNWEKTNKDGSRDKRVKDNQQFENHEVSITVRTKVLYYFYYDSTNPTKDLSFWKRSIKKR